MSNKNSITLLTLLFFILSSYSSFSQNTDWVRTYDTTLWKMDVTNTGDAIVVGMFKKSIKIAEIIDINGKTIISLVVNDGVNELSTHRFSAGVYFIRITSGGETSVQKLVISY